MTVETTVDVLDKRLSRGREWTDQLAPLTRQVEDCRLYDCDARRRSTSDIGQAYPDGPAEKACQAHRVDQTPQNLAWAAPASP